jgi:hypothetical protein
VVFNNSTWQKVDGGSTGNLTTAIISASLTLSYGTASTALVLDASKNVVSLANTGTGNNVLATSPTLVTPALGTPTSGDLANCTFPTLNQNTTGTAANVTGIVAVANGGTGTDTPALVAGTNVSITGSWPNQTINSTAAGGDVVGPASATDNALARFDTTTGELIQNSVAILDDSGVLTGLTGLTSSGTVTLSGGTASTALALNASKEVVSVANTGTGDNVLATSPTLITPALGTPSSGVVTNLTGTASININGTVGATTANTGAFTTLAYTGTLTGGTGVINIGSGQLYKDASGNVGIGTSSPKSDIGLSLHLFNGASTGTVASNSYLLVESSTRNAVVELSGSATSTNGLNFSDTPGTTVAGIASTAADQNLLFRTGGTTERMRIDSSGNVGIGTSSPTFKLDTRGSAGALANFQLTTGTNAFVFLQDTVRSYAMFSNNGAWGVYDNTAGTERMRLDSSGNLGIGTTSPGAKLDVAGNLRFSAANPAIEFNNGGPQVYSTSANTLQFATGGGIGSATERARIDSSGNLLVGTTSTPQFNKTTGSGFEATSSGEVQIASDNNCLVLNRTSAADGDVQKFFKQGVQVGTITVTGAATAYNTSSDYRLKHDIQPMTGALAKVAALKPVTYKWNADDSQSQGFIAHELQEVVPECVTGEKDAVDADGKPKYQGIDTSFLVATLAAAIQEQQANIESLKTRIEALEGAQP